MIVTSWSVYLLSSTIQLRLQIGSDFKIQLILQTEYDFIDSIDTMNKFSRFQNLIQSGALLLWWRRIRINLTIINNLKQINCWWGFEISILRFVSRLIKKIKFMFFIEKVKKNLIHIFKYKRRRWIKSLIKNGKMTPNSTY